MVPGTAAYTTEVTIRRLSSDGLTPVNETTLTYQEMEDTLDILGNGETYYYFQGPVFEDQWESTYDLQFPGYRTDWPGETPPEWINSDEKWDRVWNTTLSQYVQMEECNVLSKNLGKLKGTDIKDLCNLVGGIPSGQKVRVTAVDNMYKELPYSAIYTPNSHLGPYVLAWWSVDAGESGATSGYTGPNFTTGMRATFFADASRNPWGKHVAGLGDMFEGLPSSYHYYYVSGGITYPSVGGYTLKYVRWIDVYTNELQPVPTANFSAKIDTGRIVNGDFESQLSGWTTQGSVSTSTGSFKQSGTYGCKLYATLNNDASISQEIDLTGISSLKFWRKVYSGAERYFEVLIDGEGVAYAADYYGTATVDVIDVTGYTGTHTITFRAVCTDSESGTSTTVYLDNIDDFRDGTSGPAPLTIQFADLSTKMENPSGRSWAWDFNNDSVTDSTARNPSYTYSSPGTYTVKLTATNAAGSDTETKTAYVVTGTTPTIDIDATGGISNWPFGIGTNEDTTSVNLNVTTTASAWTVSVRDALNDDKPSGTVGKMAEYDGADYVTGGEYLTNALQVNCESEDYVTLSGTDQQIYAGTSSGTYDIGLKQEIAASDPILTAPNVYRIVITFTGATD